MYVCIMRVCVRVCVCVRMYVYMYDVSMYDVGKCVYVCMSMQRQQCMYTLTHINSEYQKL